MRGLIGVAVLTFSLLTTSVFARYLPGFDPGTEKVITIKKRLIIRFADDLNLDGVSKGFGLFRLGIPSVERIFDSYAVDDIRSMFPADIGRSNKLSRFYLLELENDSQSEQLMASLLSDPAVAAVEYDKMCLIAASPDDPNHYQQWGLHQNANDFHIHAHDAWEAETGSDTVIIAAIDTGVNYLHPDLKNNIWINPGEDLTGNMVVMDSTDINGIDEDGNTYIDDLIGYDFFNGGGYPAWPGEDAGVRDNDPNDFNGHGTHISGIASASANNSTGGTGVAGGWGNKLSDRGVQIMCLRAGYSADDGSGWERGYLVMSAVAQAMTYAARNGADIITYSAGSSFTSSLYSAMLLCRDSAEMIICTAAGNAGTSTPQSYFDTQSGLITVAATRSNDTKWSGSNYGAWVEVCAPGHQIYSTVSNHYSPSYATWTGTSMATPMVAGAAGLIKSHYPNYSKAMLEALLLNSADNIDAQNPAYIGFLGSGRINVANALSTAPVAKFEANPRSGPAPLTVNFADLSPAASSWDWDFGDGTLSSGDPTPQNSYSDPGLYQVSLEVTDPNGTDTEVKKYFIFVSADSIGGGSTTIPQNTPSPVAIYITNTVPLDEIVLALEWPKNNPTLSFSSISTSGTVSENFDYIQKVGQTSASADPQKIAIRLIPAQTTASSILEPGTHHLIDINFIATTGGTATINATTLSSYTTRVVSRFAAYDIGFAPLTVSAGLRGDANGDSFVNVADAVYLINYVFNAGPPPVSNYGGDANADGIPNVGDAVYLINYVFNGGPPPPP